MILADRPLRSVLYVPGSNSRALDKARTLSADGLILDLEDAVAPVVKEESRRRVVEAVRGGVFAPRYVMVRVNGAGTPWAEEDLAAVADAAPDGVCMPKVDSAADAAAAATALDAAGGGEIDLWCMMETPRAVLEAAAIAEEIAAARPGRGGIVMGTSDLAKELSAHHLPGRQPMLYALSACLLAARAHGLSILDGVALDLSNDARFRDECRQALALGYDGKTLIHPKTLADANNIFGPSRKDIDHAKRVIEAHRDAVEQGRGVTLLDGELIENLHVESAERLLARADAIARLTLSQD